MRQVFSKTDSVRVQYQLAKGPPQLVPPDRRIHYQQHKWHKKLRNDTRACQAYSCL